MYSLALKPSEPKKKKRIKEMVRGVEGRGGNDIDEREQK